MLVDGSINHQLFDTIEKITFRQGQAKRDQIILWIINKSGSNVELHPKLTH
jgi:hypothetical protein